MPSDDHILRDPDQYREAADKLREIARQMRYEPNRVQQLHALADGFDRLADRIEGERLEEAAS